ncbi:hypothetical protein DFH08DRAFT_815628 [Mycena albidolilacea]|uniref:Uncharacterized protein n=1 Tax=Mycena albidolilacea TaxID=1033008 RepID=A0AAD6ZMJ3_9AGAR|nr:hypothetical protein DFH08DRAFT_815628 [Mycena albidolilacea]
MSAAMKSSEKSLCSTHLIECPLQCGVVLWTYNLTAHYNSYHALKSLSNIPAVYPTSPAPAPIGNSPDAAAVNSPATSTPKLSALHPRTKRKAAKVECIYAKEVTNDQRESDAVKCIRAGCETIWAVQLQRSGVGTGFATRVRKPKREVLDTGVDLVAGMSADLQGQIESWLLL